MTISARDRLTLVERAARNVDRAAVDRAEAERVTRVTAERIAFLYSRLFGNVRVPSNQDVERLRTENAALELFRRAAYSVDTPLQLAVLRAAVDNRWGTVVQKFIKHWAGEHPIADTVQELWHLTLANGRSAV